MSANAAVALKTPTHLVVIKGGKAARGKRVKPARQEDQFDVHCKRPPAGKHTDLLGLKGLLTIEFRHGQPWEATFDPEDRSIENVIIPVLAIGAKGHDVVISSDEGRWVFVEIVAP